MNCLNYGLLILAFAAVAYCDVVKFQKCPNDGDVVACSVSEVRVNPCPEAAKNGPCVFKRGISANLQFDFVGKKGASDLRNELFWATPLADLPLTGVDTVGCHFTGCPVTGEQQTLNFTLPISKKYPSRNYEVKWKLTEADDSMKCCFLFRIRVEK